MNTKLLMSVSAIVLGIVGVALSFFPEEIQGYAGISPTPLLPVILQLLGALYLGFAALNWMAKGSIMGGIYGRPVVIGNLMHFIVGGLALLKAANGLPNATAIWIGGIVYILFALLFGVVMFSHPARALKVQTQV